MEARTTSRVGSTMLAGTACPVIRSISSPAMTAPISSTGWATVVSTGSVCRHTGASSNPDRDVPGHRQAGLTEHPQGPHRHQVGCREHGIRALPLGQRARIPASPLASL